MLENFQIIVTIFTYVMVGLVIFYSSKLITIHDLWKDKIVVLSFVSMIIIMLYILIRGTITLFTLL